MLTYSGRAKYSHGVGRSSVVSAEYEYRVGELGLAPLPEHRINLGGEYSRALSTSRRATFRFNISPSSLEISELTPNAPVTGRVYRLQGDASVDYQFRRTWRASGSYLRSVEYVAVLTRPVFADSVRADLTGLVARRVDVSISAGYAAGDSALTRDSNQLETYYGHGKGSVCADAHIRAIHGILLLLLRPAGLVAAGARTAEHVRTARHQSRFDAVGASVLSRFTESFPA